MVSAGRILILPKGDWSNATMYNMLDLVSYNGITWLCKRQCVGITPSVEQAEYWQQFGSAAPIASTSVPGLVMPDGTTITLNAETGAIAVPFAKANAKGLVQPDGTTITINNGVISAGGGAIATLSDVTLTNLANGQTLVYNSTNQKWQNGNIASALSALSDVSISSASANDLLVYDSTASKWKNIKAASALSLSDTKPLQNKVITQGLTDVLETIGSGASQAYSEGDIILCTDGYWYQASTDIAQNNTLVLNGNVTKTNQRALNTSLTQSVQDIEIKYDTTTDKPMYRERGADTWLPFSGGLSEDTAPTQVSVSAGATHTFTQDGFFWYSGTSSGRYNITITRANYEDVYQSSHLGNDYTARPVNAGDTFLAQWVSGTGANFELYIYPLV